MRLLYAVKTLSEAVGGAERVLCMICSEMVARGHDVTIVSFDSPDSRPFYDLDERVELIQLNIGDPSQSASLFQTLRRMIALRNFVCKENPDIVVGFMHSMFIPLSLCLVGTKIPVLGSEHTSSEHYRSRILQYLLFIISVPFLTKITVLSEKVKNGYVLPIRKKMVAISNPVLMPKIERKVDKRDKYRLLSVGRLEELKDHKTLIKAFKLIEPDFPDWSLKIVGDGPLKSDIDALIVELGLNTKVHVSGFTQDIEVEYAAADLFVMPSRYEAFGLVTAEAMCHGVPAIGFLDCPGTNEIIEDKVTGVLVKPGIDRVHSLAKQLSILMSDQIALSQMGQLAKQKICGKYSLQVVGDIWEQFLMSYVKAGKK